MKRADHHRTKGATVVFFSVVLLTIFWLPDFFGFGLVPTSNGYRLLAIGLAIVNGLVLYGLGERFLSYNRSGHLMLWFYLLVVFAYPQARTFSFAFLSALLAEAGLFTLFIAAEGKGRLAPLFLAGLFTTCAGLLYWPGFIMVLVVAAGALVLRIFSLRRGLIFLGGVMLPFGGVLFYRFWVFEDIWVFGEIFSKMIGHTQPGPAPDTPAALFLMGVLVYLL
ncbi:MAG: hypothetical protein FWG54_04315, partial [Bacteroidetes bacterium]|nr:hypothetical protein [Bacteroidota bacterium]